MVCIKKRFQQKKNSRLQCIIWLGRKKARKNKEFKDYASLKEWLRKEFMYYYWSKCEAEIAVGGLFIKSIEELEKIDIYSQLQPNLDRITEYVIKEMGFRFK